MSEIKNKQLQNALQSAHSEAALTFFVEGTPMTFREMTLQRLWESDLTEDNNEIKLAIHLGEGTPLEYITKMDLTTLLLAYLKTADLPDFANDINELENALLLQIATEKSEWESAVSSLQSNLTLKENVANKSNEIDNSTTLYPNNNAVKTELEILRDAVQEVADKQPYILQGKGDSTEDVMSQKAVTDALALLEYAIANIENTNGGTIEFPEIDLSDYPTSAQMHSAIKDITGDLLDLETTNKESLTGAINENKNRIGNNVTSITGLQTEITGLSQGITDLQNADYQTQIDNLNTKNTELKTNINNIKQFNTYEANDEASALEYSIANLTTFVYTVL